MLPARHTSFLFHFAVDSLRREAPPLPQGRALPPSPGAGRSILPEAAMVPRSFPARAALCCALALLRVRHAHPVSDDLPVSGGREHLNVGVTVSTRGDGA